MKPISSSHSTARIEQDLTKIVEELASKSNVFVNKEKRSHTTLKVHGSIFHSVKIEKLMKWMKVRLYHNRYTNSDKNASQWPHVQDFAQTKQHLQPEYE